MLPPNELIGKFIEDAGIFGVKIGNEIKPNMLTQVMIISLHLYSVINYERVRVMRSALF